MWKFRRAPVVPVGAEGDPAGLGVPLQGAQGEAPGVDVHDPDPATAQKGDADFQLVTHVQRTRRRVGPPEARGLGRREPLEPLA